MAGYDSLLMILLCWIYCWKGPRRFGLFWSGDREFLLAALQKKRTVVELR